MIPTARIQALARLLLDSGDITPTGARILQRVCDENTKEEQ